MGISGNTLCCLSLALFQPWGVSRGKSVGEQWWQGGESTRLPPMLPGFDSRLCVISGLSLLVLHSVFFSCMGTPVFSSPQKLDLI